jgi:hypothetical protein
MDTGPFDLKMLSASDYNELRRQNCECPLLEEHYVIALPAVGEGTFYRVSSNGDRTVISRREYRHLAHWCKVKCEQSPSGKIFLLFQDVLDNPAEATTNVDMTKDYTKFSQNEGELSVIHVVEADIFIPDHGIHEASLAVLSQKELDLAVSFLHNMYQELPSSIPAELITWTTRHHSLCAPSPPSDEQMMLQDRSPSRKHTLSDSTSSTPKAIITVSIPQPLSQL